MKGQCCVQKNIEEYDLLRVILTILVVFGHSMYLTFNTKYGRLEFYDSAYNILSKKSLWFYNIFYLFCNWIYSFHMPMFFCLSGAVFALGKEKYTDFNLLLIKKTKRLLVPYFLVGCLYMIPIKFIVGFYNKNLKDIVGVYSSYFSFNLTESGQLWFIMSLYAMFIFVYHINYIFVKNKDSSKRWISVALIYMYMYMYINATRTIPLYTNYCNNFMINQYFVFFVAGYIFEFVREKINYAIKKYTKTSSIIMLAFLLVSIYNINIENPNPNFSISIYPMIFTYILCYKMSIKKALIKSKFYDFIKSKAWHIYLLHDPINFIILFSSFKYFKFSFFSSSKLFIIYYLCRNILNICICAIISYLFSKFKNKFVKFSLIKSF